jgi:hypothetical protein
MLSKTSLFTLRVLTIRFLVSRKAKMARFDAVVPHSASELPRCGVPRNTTNLVRERQIVDRRIAYS